MSVLSKLIMEDYSFPYNCYELGHTWTPFCSKACLDISFFVFKDAFRMYACLYILTQLVSKDRFELSAFKRTITSTLQSSSFLGFNAFAAIAAFCISRRFIGKFYLPFVGHFPAIVASFMAIYLERPSRRPALAFYVTNIAAESVYKLAVAKGLPVRLPAYGEVVLFTASISMLTYLIKRNGYGNDFVSLTLKLLLGKEETTSVQYQQTNSTRKVTTAGGRSEKVQRGTKVSEENQGFTPTVHSKKTTTETGKTVVKETDQPHSPETLEKTLKKISSELDFKTRRDSSSQRGSIWSNLLNSINSLWFGWKHSSCPHGAHSCISYSSLAFLRNFALGWTFYGSLTTVMRFKKLISNPKILLNIWTGHRGLRLGLFLGLFTFIYKVVACGLRWANNGDQEWHHLAAGLCAGPSMCVSPSSTIAQYIFWKCLETLYFLGVKNGYITRVSLTMSIAYAVSCSQLFYVSVVNPNFMRPSYMKFLLRVTNNYLALLNRNIINLLGTNSSAGFEVYIPELDEKYISRRYKESVLLWML